MNVQRPISISVISGSQPRSLAPVPTPIIHLGHQDRYSGFYQQCCQQQQLRLRTAWKRVYCSGVPPTPSMYCTVRITFTLGNQHPRLNESRYSILTTTPNIVNTKPFKARRIGRLDRLIIAMRLIDYFGVEKRCR